MNLDQMFEKNKLQGESCIAKDVRVLCTEAFLIGTKESKNIFKLAQKLWNKENCIIVTWDTDDIKMNTEHFCEDLEAFLRVLSEIKKNEITNIRLRFWNKYS